MVPNSILQYFGFTALNCNGKSAAADLGRVGVRVKDDRYKLAYMFLHRQWFYFN
jgi:hypothetical protein